MLIMLEVPKFGSKVHVVILQAADYGPADQSILIRNPNDFRYNVNVSTCEMVYDFKTLTARNTCTTLPKRRNSSQLKHKPKLHIFV